MGTTVDLSDITERIHKVLSETVCARLFRRVRTTERERVWSLGLLVKFWIEVTLHAPESLTRYLRKVLGTTFPKVSEEGFFDRCQNLSWRFFAAAFQEFVECIAKQAKPVFASTLKALQERFPQVVIIDGTRLDKIARKMKILWHTRQSVLPGCLFIVYDLFRGIPSLVKFDPDAAASEITACKNALGTFRPGTLMVGDALYGRPRIFEKLQEKSLYGLFRRDPHVSYKDKQVLREVRTAEGDVEESIIIYGAGPATRGQRVRFIRRRKPHFELVTNILDPAVLSAEEALHLYRKRWKIEHFIQDLKCLFDLHHFYAANPNAVAMQIYAAVIVYTAMRVAQGDIAEEHTRPPEDLSTHKVFMSLAAASKVISGFGLGVESVVDANPGVPLTIPSPRGTRGTSVMLEDLLADRRPPGRRDRRRKGVVGPWKCVVRMRAGRKFR